jgi:hypothetical protein
MRSPTPITVPSSQRIARVDADVRELRGEVKGVQRTMVCGFITSSGIMVTGFLALAGMQIF